MFSKYKSKITTNMSNIYIQVQTSSYYFHKTLQYLEKKNITLVVFQFLDTIQFFIMLTTSYDDVVVDVSLNMMNMCLYL